MVARRARFAAVTGAPGAGKSTLLEAVSQRGIATGPEVARAILQSPGGMDLRAAHPVDFAHAMLEAQMRLRERMADVAGPVLFDRGLPDIVGFLKVADHPVPEEIDRACRIQRYDGPIFHAPAWRAIYRQDEERIQSWEEAVASDEAVTAAWRHYGYELVRLPEAAPEIRAQMVVDRLV